MEAFKFQVAHSFRQRHHVLAGEETWSIFVRKSGAYTMTTSLCTASSAKMTGGTIICPWSASEIGPSQRESHQIQNG